MQYNYKYKEIIFLAVLIAGVVIAGCDKEDEITPVEPEPQENPAVVDSTKTDTVDYALKKVQKFYLNNCFPYYYNRKWPEVQTVYLRNFFRSCCRHG